MALIERSNRKDLDHVEVQMHISDATGGRQAWGGEFMSRSADGILKVSGLPETRLNELLRFEGGRIGFAVRLDADAISAIPLDEGNAIEAGARVTGTGVHLLTLCSTIRISTYTSSFIHLAALSITNGITAIIPQLKNVDPKIIIAISLNIKPKSNTINPSTENAIHRLPYILFLSKLNGLCHIDFSLFTFSILSPYFSIGEISSSSFFQIRHRILFRTF
jgi:hypothetical protein